MKAETIYTECIKKKTVGQSPCTASPPNISCYTLAGQPTTQYTVKNRIEHSVLDIKHTVLQNLIATCSSNMIPSLAMSRKTEGKRDSVTVANVEFFY